MANQSELDIILDKAIHAGCIRRADVSLAKHLSELANDVSEELFLLVSLLSFHTSQGHVCLELSSIDKKFSEFIAVTQYRFSELPILKKLFGRTSLVGKPGDFTPLIIDRDLLYLGRYWSYEKTVADALLKHDGFTMDTLPVQLEPLFNIDVIDTDWQKVAAAIACLKPFCVISGGPGTGKTHTVSSILVLLLSLSNVDSLNIALAAPTGKAAARLRESIRHAKSKIKSDEAIRELIPEEATTIHRLLGIIPGKVLPRYHADNKLNLDVLVVDEASMIDLPLMAKLMMALPDKAKVILLGDKDQLASVEAGSVFADICHVSEESVYTEKMIGILKPLLSEDLKTTTRAFSDNIALLKKSYRFSKDKGIGYLASAVNAGDVQRSLECFKQHYDDIALVSKVDIKQELKRVAVENYKKVLEENGPLTAYQKLSDFQVLCAVRSGLRGVVSINETIESILNVKGDYKGRPIMISRNDYNLGLFNGDIGLFWPDPDSDSNLKVWFKMSDGSFKKVIPGQLPEHETAWAMTVHKSQGSEFSKVLLILPDKQVEVVTRELLYTAITRAKTQVEIWSDNEIFTKAVNNKTQRDSGLAQRLYG